MKTSRIARMAGARGWVAATAGLASVMIALASTGCGNVTAGGFAEVSVDVSGDAASLALLAPQPSLQAVPQMASLSGASGPAASSHENDPEGEIEVDFRLALVSADGGTVSLGRDDIRVRVDIQGVNEAEAVNELVPAGHYTALRIHFTHIQIEVEGGLVVDGTPIVGEVRVELEGPSLLVSRPLDLVAREGDAVAMVVDLNTPAWLEALDPVARTIDPSVFAGLVDVVVR